MNINRSFQREKFHKDDRRSKHNPAKPITDADYVDDLALFADTVAQAESLDMKQAARGIGLYLDSGKKISYLLNYMVPIPH